MRLSLNLIFLSCSKLVMNIKRKVVCSIIGLLCCVWSFARSRESTEFIVIPLEETTYTLPEDSANASADSVMVDRMPQFSPDGEWNRLFRLKTNALGWLLLISNVTA